LAAPLAVPGSGRHLADAAPALDLRLTDEEVQRLEAPSTPRTPTGFE